MLGLRIVEESQIQNLRQNLKLIRKLRHVFPLRHLSRDEKNVTLKHFNVICAKLVEVHFASIHPVFSSPLKDKT